MNMVDPITGKNKDFVSDPVLFPWDNILTVWASPWPYIPFAIISLWHYYYDIIHDAFSGGIKPK